MSHPFTVSDYFRAHALVAASMDHTQFQAGIELIRRKFDAGKKIFTCGNGGSASTASHYITDWNKMINLATGRKFRGISLCDNIGAITAFANDVSYDEVFAGQLKASMDEGDLVIAISGSGNSPNVLRAVEYANANGADTLAVVGYDGGKLLPLAKAAHPGTVFRYADVRGHPPDVRHMVMKTLCGNDIKITNLE